jgi:hypothetical protein
MCADTNGFFLAHVTVLCLGLVLGELVPCDLDVIQRPGSFCLVALPPPGVAVEDGVSSGSQAASILQDGTAVTILLLLTSYWSDVIT